jgi:hypothetical protein
MFYPAKTGQKRKPADLAGFERGKSLLPSALLVAVRLEALPAFVLRHLEATFLLKVTHGESV